MRPHHTRVLAVVLLLIATLTGCGGGCDSGMTNPPPSSQGTYNLQAAVTALVRSGLSANVTLSGNVLINGVSTPFTGTGTYTLSAGTSGTFNRAAALLQAEKISGTVTGGGQSSPYAVSVVNAYDTTTTNFLGRTQSDEIDVAQSPIVFPISVPNSAPLGTISRYTDQTLSVVLGTTDLSIGTLFTTVPTPDRQLVQFTYKTYDTNHTLVQTDSLTFSLSSSNVLYFASAQTQDSSGTLTVQAQ